jgi:hypothetical protein
MRFSFRADTYLQTRYLHRSQRNRVWGCGLTWNVSEQGLRAAVCERRNKPSPFTQEETILPPVPLEALMWMTAPCSCKSRRQRNTILGDISYSHCGEYVLWDVAPCGLVQIYRRFRDAYYIHHKGYPAPHPWTQSSGHNTTPKVPF